MRSNTGMYVILESQIPQCSHKKGNRISRLKLSGKCLAQSLTNVAVNLSYKKVPSFLETRIFFFFFWLGICLYSKESFHETRIFFFFFFFSWLGIWSIVRKVQKCVDEIAGTQAGIGSSLRMSMFTENESKSKKDN